MDEWFKTIWNTIAPEMIKQGWAPSPEGMFEMGGALLAAWYDHVGEGVVADTDAKVEEKCDKMEEDIAAETAKLNESINKALAGAFPELG